MSEETDNDQQIADGLVEKVRHNVAAVVDSIDRAETNRILNLLFDQLLLMPFAERSAWFQEETKRSKKRAEKRVG